MRKYILMISAIFLCLILPGSVRAAQSEIGTTVPTTHSVSIEAEHASALYLQGTKGESDTYTVPRFSEPEFRLSVEDGYQMGRILLNGTDVTAQVKDGVLKLSEVYEDQVITIETKEIVSGEVTVDTGSSVKSQPKAENTKSPDQPQTTGTALSAKTSDSARTGIAVLLLGCGIIMLLGAYRKKHALK